MALTLCMQISDLSVVTLNLRESSTDDDDSAFGSSSHQVSSEQRSSKYSAVICLRNGMHVVYVQRQ